MKSVPFSREFVQNKFYYLHTQFSGVLCGIAGNLSLARINSAKADFGSSYIMQCILISVLGGINPNGGFGAVPGVIICSIYFTDVIFLS